MSEEQQLSIALVRQYYDTFNSGNRSALLNLLSEDVQHEVNQSGIEVGRDAFSAFLTRMDRCYEEQVKELEVFVNNNGTRVAAEFFIDGRYLHTDQGLPEARNQSYYLRVGAFFEVHDHKISRVTNYYNLQEWLQLISA